jgi:hypothetical protein
MSAPIIAPTSPIGRDGKSSTIFTADQNVTWTKSGGTLSDVAARSVTWTAPNQTGVWTLTGTNGSAQATIISITVRAIIPNFWKWQNPVHATKDVLIFKPIFGPTQTRGFGDGSPILGWELSNDDSSYDNFIELKAFWDYHHPGRQFDMIDPNIPERRTYETDSDLDYSYNHADSVTWAMRIKESYPYALVT